MMGSEGQGNAPLCKKIDNYVFKFSDLLGQGNFSKVYRGTHELTNENVAIKVVELSSLKSTKLQELLFSEIDVLKKLNHPNILRCFEVFSSKNNCYIVTEVCNGGDLETKLRSSQYFSESQAEPYILDIFKGLRYLSENHVIHRDLKVANIFLHNGVAKIADFGFAKFTKQNFKDINIGSPIYMSPEGLLENIYGPKTDIWAFGIFIYELLHGKTPFYYCKSEIDLKRQISIPISYSSLRNDISFDLKEIIIKCLETSEEKRPSIFELEETGYFKKILKRDTIPLGGKRVNPMIYSEKRDQRNGEVDHYSQDKNRIKDNKSFYVNQQMNSNYLQFNGGSHQNRVNASYFQAPTPNRQNQRRGYTSPYSGANRPYSAEKTINTFEMRPKQQPIINVTQNNNFLTNSPKITQLNAAWQKKPYSTDPRNGHHQVPTRSRNTGNSPVLPGIINFKQSVNTLHYCRLLYKYLIMVKEGQYDPNVKKYHKILTSWMFRILNEISHKVQRKQIVYDEETTRKETKLKQVTNEYFRKYSAALEKPAFLDQEANFDTIIRETTSRIHQHDSYQLYRPEMNNILHLAFFLLKILESTRLLKRCSVQLRFWEWSEYKQIQEFLVQSKSSLTYHGYLQLRKKVLQ